MSMADIPDVHVAILLRDGFEQGNLTSVRDVLRDNEIKTTIISPATGPLRGWNDDDIGAEFDVDVLIQNAKAGKYEGLLIPGGIKSIDRLRNDEDVLEFIRPFFVEEKPVTAIGHAPWLLVDTGVIRGYSVTSSPSIQIDMRNGGAKWVERDMVESANLITIHGGDLESHARKFLEKLVKYQDAFQSA